MNQYFYSYNFTQCFNSVNTEFIWDQLKIAIYNALNWYVSSTPSKLQTNLNGSFPHQAQSQGLRTLRRRLAAHPTENIKQKIRSTESELQGIMAQAKSDYESQLVLNFAHSHNKKIFQYISNIRG